MDVNMNQVNTLLTSTQTSADNKPAATSAGTTEQGGVSVGEAAVYESTAGKKADTVYTPDYTKIQEMLKENDEKVNSFRMLLEKLFNKQGMTFQQSIAELRSVLSKDGTKLNIEVDEATRKKAEEDISEDGYWGVDKTAGRIMDFAKALSGGDPSKIETLRKAVQGAFKDAEKQWGSKLPEISQKTYDEVMNRFDKWAEESRVSEEATKAAPIQ